MIQILLEIHYKHGLNTILLKKIFTIEFPIALKFFPDFYSSGEDEENLLELKAFNYNETPAFDVANFASYCDSLILKPYRLFADYIILGYTMTNGSLKIEKIWKKKVWEICSTSSNHKLRVQDKKGTIYNIRPCTWYSNRSNATSPFENKEIFVQAIYETLKNYNRRHVDADQWLYNFLKSYENYYGEPFNIQLSIKYTCANLLATASTTFITTVFPNKSNPSLTFSNISKL